MGLKANLSQLTRKAISTSADDVVRYVKPLQKTNIEGLRLAPSAIGDTTTFTLNSVEHVLKDSSVKIFEKIYGFTPPEQKRLAILMENISRGVGNNLEIISKRCDAILGTKSRMRTFLITHKVKDVDFFIKNFDELEKFKGQYGFDIGPDINRLLPIINKESFALLKSGKNSAEIEKIAQKIIYDSKATGVRLGTQTVDVNFSDVVAIVSGKQSLSYFKTGSSCDFEKTVLKLTEIANPQKGQQYYHQISEGILEQRPDLIKIVDELCQTIKTSQIPERKAIENFFARKDFPETITLRTVVPDENALTLPEHTFQIFKARYNG